MLTVVEMTAALHVVQHTQTTSPPRCSQDPKRGGLKPSKPLYDREHVPYTIALFSTGRRTRRRLYTLPERIPSFGPELTRGPF